MYKGNGETKIFPLPPGVDGHNVSLVSGNVGWRMKEGEAYVVQDGSVIFKVAPPTGMRVGFGTEDNDTVVATEVSPSSKAMTVIYGDGTMEIVTEDPVVMLAKAREMYKKSQEMLKAAVSAQGAIRIIAEEQRQIAEASFSGRLSRYEGLVEESVKSAASMARDDLQSHINKLIAEVRNKHKATIEAHDAVQAMLRGAKSELSKLADTAVLRMERNCEPLLNQLHEMRALAAEMRELEASAKCSAASAGADVIRTFGEHATLVLEGIKSVKSALSIEVKSVIEAAQRTMNAEIEQARAHRDLAGQAARRAEEVERKASEMVGR